jgi:nucleoside-diphosphate-sugar epimerase
MRALVSGGAGHIGSHLCALLLRDGHTVICVDNLSTGHRRNLTALLGSPRFVFVEHDVVLPFDPPAPVDAVFHLASPASPLDYLSHPLETLAVNSQGTWNLLRLAEQHGARFLFASTSEVYGDPHVHPQPECYWGHVNPNGVRSCYDESKRFGESLTLTYGRQGRVDVRIVRIFNTYGPHSRPDDGRLVPNLIAQALRGEPLTIYGDGRQTRSLCYVTDTAAGIAAAMIMPDTSGEVINLGNPDERSVLDFAQVIARVCEVPLRIVHEPLPIDDPVRRCPDITRARRLLGWEPRVSLEEGLVQTVAWFRSILETAPAR